LGPRGVKGFLGLNGGVDALLETGRRFWALGVGIAVIVGWVLSVNQTGRGQVQDRVEAAEMRKELKLQHALADDVHVEVRAIRADMVTNADMDFLLGQSLATHRVFDKRLRLLEHKPAQEGLGRWDYYPQYGTVPDKYRLWFEPASPAQWLDAKAKGR
jgi:hypothetical protein